MKVSLVQFSPVWGSPEASRKALQKLLDTVPSTDLIVLPEMFSTGFVTAAPAGVAETGGESLRFMQEIAAARDCAVAGSIAIETEGRFRNRFYFVYPDGSEVHYDKRHLFTYGGEHHKFTAGQEPVVAEFRGVRILLQVCYDLRFPCFSRNNGKIPYDCAIYVASWPTSRLAVWDTLLHARAIENQCYVAGVNRVGEDESGRYSGGTLLVDPYGNTAAACPLDEDAAITVELDVQRLRDFRRKFPVLKDAD